MSVPSLPALPGAGSGASTGGGAASNAALSGANHTFLTQDPSEPAFDYGAGATAPLDMEMEPLSQSTKLHHKMREMKEMDEALERMKLSYKQRSEAVREGEQKFLEKQKNVIKYLKRFKTFVVETDTKRQRAEKKEQEERKQRDAKTKDIEDLRAHFLELQQKRNDLKQRNEHYKQNRSYLEQVKEASDQYAEMDELLTRYTILKQTNEDLTRENDAVNKKVEATQSQLQHLHKSKQNEILVQNSKFASLLKKLEDETNRTSAVENEVAGLELRTKDMNRYFCEVQMAIKNIYQRTLSSLPHQKAAAERKKIQLPLLPQTGGQQPPHLFLLLDCIVERLLDLAFIVDSVWPGGSAILQAGGSAAREKDTARRRRGGGGGGGGGGAGGGGGNERDKREKLEENKEKERDKDGAHARGELAHDRSTDSFSRHASMAATQSKAALSSRRKSPTRNKLQTNDATNNANASVNQQNRAMSAGNDGDELSEDASDDNDDSERSRTSSRNQNYKIVENISKLKIKK